MKFALLSILFISTNLYAAKAIKFETSTEFVKNDFFSITKNDKALALKLHRLNQSIQNNKPYINEVKKIYSSLNDNPLFNTEFEWLKVLNRIYLEKNIETIVTHCSLKSNTFSNELNKSLSKVCNNSFISTASTYIKANKLLNDKALQYFKDNIRDIYYNVKNKDLISFYNTAKGAPSFYQYASFVLVEYTTNESIKLAKALKNTLSPHIVPLKNSPQITVLNKNDNLLKVAFQKELKTLDKLINDQSKAYKVKQHTNNILKISKNISNFNSSTYEKKLDYLGKRLLRHNYFNETRLVYKQLIKQTKKENYHFYYLWSYIRANKMDDAFNYISSNGLVAKGQSINDPRLLFWMGQILKDKNPKIATSLYTRIVKKFSLNYYAVLSSEILKEQGQNDLTLTSVIAEKKADQDLFHNAEISNTNKLLLKRVKLWNTLNLNTYQSFDVSKVYDQKNKKLDILLAEVFNSNRDYLSSFKTIYHSFNNHDLQASKHILNLLYPKPFLASIQGNKSKINPLLTLSLIRQESGFNPDALSRVGARGLMQLMPKTARSLRRSVKNNELTDPFININLGTKYLNGLLKKYDNNIIYSLAAYNAGENRIDNWKDKYFQKKTLLHDIEDIPFNETEMYVKLIFRNIYFYNFLNKDSDSQSQNTIVELLSSTH